MAVGARAPRGSPDVGSPGGGGAVTASTLAAWGAGLCGAGAAVGAAIPGLSGRGGMRSELGAERRVALRQ